MMDTTKRIASLFNEHSLGGGYPAIEQRSATFAGTDKSPSESSSAVLTRDLLSASVSVFSSPGQMIRVVSHPEELFHADLFIPKLRYSSANMSKI
ncbi:hypothetical protein T4E_4556 [Trichinella pseudospiralis]|uniref:Uncharacterized protein n=1 Tax=Trichinella pseudospiralis TaxID=6337 RepID=A0A0V0XN51_TRIPS|nr:hypothetical protein T4E_4556 [Trichinella pseudospiralis]